LNFLSHYYFERYAANAEQVLGGLLPDLLKNIDKGYGFHLHKYADKLGTSPTAAAITEGWNRHVAVDKIFHNCDFFYKHTHALRKDLETVVADLPIRPTFLAHISLELLLDHKLIVHNMLSVARLYEHLNHVNRNALSNYLKNFETIDLEGFYYFYDRFLESKYIFEYAKLEKVSYALFNICKRIWSFEPSEAHYAALTARLQAYQQEKLTDYFDVFNYINQQLD